MSQRGLDMQDPEKTTDELAEKEYYVLITCSKPNEAGDMNVEMRYQGDNETIAYLLENAQNFLSDSEQAAL